MEGIRHEIRKYITILFICAMDETFQVLLKNNRGALFRLGVSVEMLMMGAER